MAVDVSRHRAAAAGPEEIGGQRLSAVHRYLLDGLYEAEPAAAIVGRLAVVADSEAILFGADGAVEARSGERLPEGHLWRALAARPGLPLELAVAGREAYAAPVRRDDGEAVAGWLVLVGRDAATPLARAAALSAAPLLAAVRRLGAAARRQERAIRAGLLEELLAADRSRDDAVLAARAASFGLRSGAALRAVSVRPPEPTPAASARLARGLREALEAAALPHLLTAREAAAIALVEAGAERLERLLAPLAAAQPGALAGVGRELRDIAAAAESLRDAELAVERLRRDGAGPVLCFEQLDLGSLVVAEGPTGRVAAAARQVLERLRADPVADEAVRAFLAHEQSVPVAARALYLHPNSLRYRLAKAEKALGRSLKDPATITTLYISFAAESRLGEDAAAAGGAT